MSKWTLLTTTTCCIYRSGYGNARPKVNGGSSCAPSCNRRPIPGITSIWEGNMISWIESLETVFDLEALLIFPISKPSQPTQSAQCRIISLSAELPHIEKLIKLYDKQHWRKKKLISNLSLIAAAFRFDRAFWLPKISLNFQWLLATFTLRHTIIRTKVVSTLSSEFVWFPQYSP